MCIVLPADIVPSNSLETIQDVLYVYWKIAYWTSLIFTWLLIPTLQVYSTSGEFGFFSKCRAALYNNAKRYAIILCTVVSICVWCYVSDEISVAKVSTLLLCMSTSFGLIFLTLLLGNGVYTVPKQFWKSTQ
uniref:LMBR1 domain-containing protein 2 n=1 Tax=Lygus hesperus TaxID=30085 RepID=A0A0A9X1P0_LYGHE